MFNPVQQLRSFSGQGDALIYDANFQPKAAYTAVHNALDTAVPSGYTCTTP